MQTEQPTPLDVYMESREWREVANQYAERGRLPTAFEVSSKVAGHAADAIAAYAAYHGLDAQTSKERCATIDRILERDGKRRAILRSLGHTEF